MRRRGRCCCASTAPSWQPWPRDAEAAMAKHLAEVLASLPQLAARFPEAF
jgi:hypothetical protein